MKTLLFLFKCFMPPRYEKQLKWTSFQWGSSHTDSKMYLDSAICVLSLGNCSKISKNKYAHYLNNYKHTVQSCTHIWLSTNQMQINVTVKLTKWQQQKPHDSSALHYICLSHAINGLRHKHWAWYNRNSHTAHGTHSSCVCTVVCCCHTAPQLM